jgi:hypothetical protein
VSACLAFVEAIWGLQMVVFEGAEFFPAQSYSNLIGWISLALYGTYYRISRRHFDYVDKIQVFLAVIGTVLLAAGATIINVGGPHIPMNIGGGFRELAIRRCKTDKKPPKVNVQLSGVSSVLAAGVLSKKNCPERQIPTDGR